MTREVDTAKRRALLVHLRESHGRDSRHVVMASDDYPEGVMRRNHRRTHEWDGADHKHPGIKNKEES